MRRRLVLLMEVLALGAALVFVVMLFANDLDGRSAGGRGSAQPASARAIYVDNCAYCHGTDGGGGVGPQLAGKVVARFPDVDDEIAVVTNGRNAMPGWSGTLSKAEIRRVVEYTRTSLGG